MNDGKKPNQAMKNKTKLTILQINDTHGYLEPIPNYLAR